jgi:hypothetical protein
MSTYDKEVKALPGWWGVFIFYLSTSSLSFPWPREGFFLTRFISG